MAYLPLGNSSQLADFVDANREALLYCGAMLSVTQKKILEALFRALRPVARALLRSGIGYREFAEIAKSAFVNVATSDYGIRGRPTNTSRVAVMTGLTRKEVKRLRDLEAAGAMFQIKKEVAPGAVLDKWHSHMEFTDANGDPKVLDFSGGKGSFSDLVKRFGGDIPAGAMRTELLRVGAIEEVEDGRLRVLKSVFTPADLDDRLAVAFEFSLRRLGETILFNTDPANQDHVRVERTITTMPITQEDLPRLRRISRKRLEEFGSSIQEFFSTYESMTPESPGEDGRAIGIGFYYYEQSGPEQPD